MERGAAVVVAAEPEPALVQLDERTADRKTDAHAGGFARRERHEELRRGFVAEDSTAFLQDARQVVMRTLEGSSSEECADWGLMKEKIRVDLKRYVTKQTNRRPLIIPVILEL